MSESVVSRWALTPVLEVVNSRPARSTPYKYTQGALPSGQAVVQLRPFSPRQCQRVLLDSAYLQLLYSLMNGASCAFVESYESTHTVASGVCKRSNVETRQDIWTSSVLSSVNIHGLYRGEQSDTCNFRTRGALDVE